MDKKFIRGRILICILLRKYVVILLLDCRELIKVIFIFCPHRMAEQKLKFFLIPVDIRQYLIGSLVALLDGMIHVRTLGCLLYALHIHLHQTICRFLYDCGEKSALVAKPGIYGIGTDSACRRYPPHAGIMESIGKEFFLRCLK